MESVNNSAPVNNPNVGTGGTNNDKPRNNRNNNDVSHVKSKDKDNAPNPGSNNNAPPLEPPKKNVMSMSELALMIVELQSKISSEQIVNAKEDADVKRVQKKEINDERIEKIQDAIDSMSKASKGGVFGKIFGWVATAAMAVAGAALIATGAGAVAGGMLLAASAVMITQQTSAETGDWMNEGIGEVFKAMGMSDTAAAIMTQVTVAVVVIALSAGSGYMASGAQAANSATQLQAAAKVVSTLTTRVSAGAEIAQGGSGIAVSVYSYNAQVSRADAAQLALDGEELMMMLEEVQEKIMEILEQYNLGVTIAIEVMNGVHETKMNTTQNV